MSTQVDDDFSDPNPDRPSRAVALPDARTLREMSPAEILAAIAVNGEIGSAVEVLESDQFGPILDNKDVLVGVPFYVIDWVFHDGDFGNFATAQVMTNAGDKFLLNDGSTGIADQLRMTQDRKGIVPFLAAKGLRRSDYEKEIDGKITKATTYYIDTSL